MTVKIVFVVGAGASAEVGLPVGAAMKDIIANYLNLRYDYNLTGGDRRIASALEFVGREDPSGFQKYLDAAWHIRDALPPAPSIDNFLDSHRGNKLIELCGKLAIVRSILAAEHKSKLMPMELGRTALNHSALRETWFSKLTARLFEQCTLDELPARLKQVAFVVFNYDRCIEHYLADAIRLHYGVSVEQGQALVSTIVIVHPYGTVGALPWEKRQGASHAPFGHEPTPQELVQLAAEVKTFTEGMDSASEGALQVRRAISMTSRIVFLGFAYLPLNMDLLFRESMRAQAAAIIGTALHLSHDDRDAIAKELAAHGTPSLHDATCSQLFDTRSRVISFTR